MTKDDPSANFFRDWEKQQREQESSARKSLRKACQQLAKLKVDTVTINYDGYGDSGTLDDPVALRDGKPFTLPDNLNDRLLEIAEAFLPGGWEDGEGACGEFLLNMTDCKFIRDHKWRVTQYEHEEEEIPL